jgi:hypothetical protein
LFRPRGQILDNNLLDLLNLGLEALPHTWRITPLSPALAADPMPCGYVVRDANGQALAYVYSRDNEAEARQAKVLTNDEARRIAVDVARLPELLGKVGSD